MAEIANKELIDDIVDREWVMFSHVNNVGGPAACQSQRQTFTVMRTAQFTTWSAATLASYRNDLRVAADEGRNLMTEKYARMMAVTHPDEYAQIAPMLPPVLARTGEIADSIADQHVQWDQETAAQYPRVRGRGRPMLATQPSGQTTADTYERAELLTYSPQTLALLLDDTRRAAEEGRNLVTEQLAATMRLVGFESLDAAEAAL